MVSDSNKSIPVKNPLVEEAKIKEKKAYEIADRTLSKYWIKTKDIKIVGSRAKWTEKPTSDIDKPMIQLLDEKTPWYIKNSLELAQSPTTMGRYISEILWKDIKNVSVKDISEFYKKYWPFPKWEKRLQEWVTWYEKWRMPWMSENGYKQDKLLLEAFYWK